ncbi:protein pelota-like isoform X2 [Paramacrobiotus metropolitanus]|nr:protein pelota-like isoform X2 [Paramacrobiotus metropolitanus]XP_055342372.1 protein pelota-like isoform X2 [Paramacrobiotus metropolitanus]
MWHAYNLISEGDLIRASTIRKVNTESATGSTSANRVRTTLTLAVENVDFDTQAGMLRVKGRNTEENEYVKMGAYHTIDLEMNRKFTIIKPNWDSIALEILDNACDVAQHADLAVVVMQEGLAHVCLITPSMTTVRAKVDVTIPRKRKGNIQQHEKGMQKFFDAIVQAILRHLNFDVLKCILLASPGFIKDQLYDYMLQWATKIDEKKILDNKSKFILAHSSSGFKHSVKELLADPNLTMRLTETRAAGEVKALDSFYQMMHNEPTRAYYGINHVEKANESQAVELLMISDALFRSSNINQRKRFVKLVESVKESGGQARIFSSMHVSGEQLGQLSGIAAVLRFPMPEIEDEEEDEVPNTVEQEG